jgi:hypothetical protein
MNLDFTEAEIRDAHEKASVHGWGPDTMTHALNGILRAKLSMPAASNQKAPYELLYASAEAHLAFARKKAEENLIGTKSNAELEKLGRVPWDAAVEWLWSFLNAKGLLGAAPVETHQEFEILQKWRRLRDGTQILVSQEVTNRPDYTCECHGVLLTNCPSRRSPLR